MNPKVSVLIPAFNAESTVESAVRSILRQSFDDFEIVIVDDGSTDSTLPILDSLARSDARVRVIRAEHGGIIQALNTGIAASEGELIARMDADDLSHLQRLELQVQLMDEHPDVSVCSSLVRMFPRNGLLGGLISYEDWLNSLTDPEAIARDIFVESPVAHPSVMLRRSELIEVGAYQERGWAEDYDLWLRYHLRGSRFAKVPHTLVAWRQSEGRLTFTDGRYSLENFLRAKAHYLAKMLSGTGREIVLWGAGKMGRRLLKHLVREGLEIEDVIDIDPRKTGDTLRGRPIVSADYLQGRPNSFVIAAVGSRMARELIRERLIEFGLLEIRDFLCAA